MKKYYLVAGLISVLGFQSCEELLNDVVPDVNTSLSKSFQVQIYQNSGSLTEAVMDISSANEYADFKNIVKGYELDKITYQIKNANVPNDMYIAGSIICKNDSSTQTLTVANIPRVKISDVATAGTEVEVAESVTDIATVLGWLKAQGKFKATASYTLTDGQSAPYVISTPVAGSNFELIIRFYIVVKTGV